MKKDEKYNMCKVCRLAIITNIKTYNLQCPVINSTKTKYMILVWISIEISFFGRSTNVKLRRFVIVTKLSLYCLLLALPFVLWNNWDQNGKAQERFRGNRRVPDSYSLLLVWLVFFLPFTHKCTCETKL